MSTPPLLKPRHADGRLMTEDEIRGLKGWAIRYSVAEFVAGWKDVYAPDGLGRRNERGGKLEGDEAIPYYESDIAAAFDVDRPDWRWEMEDYDHNHFDVMVADRAAAKSVIYEQRLDRKPTPQDYARARCVAALLLAAKIGE